MRLLRTTTKPPNGYFGTARRVIALDTDLSIDQAAKTLTHETAHYVAGHTSGMNSRNVETAAESVT